MSKARIALFAAVCLVGLIVVSTIAVVWLIKPDRHQVELAASTALGMQVTIAGETAVDFSWRLQIGLDDVGLHNVGTDVLSAQRALVEVEYLPLLRRRVVIASIALSDVSIFIKRDEAGGYNFLRSERGRADLPAWALGSLSLTNATLRFEGTQPADAFQAHSCNVSARDLHATAQRAEFLRTLSLTATFDCAAINAVDIVLAEVKAQVVADNGVIELNPVTLRVLDAPGTGQLVANFRGALPHWDVQFSLPQFPVEAFFDALARPEAGTGAMDFSMSLSMAGQTREAMRQSLAGRVSLRGSNLSIMAVDLDEELARFEASQNFNLIDVGAFFVAGPLGLVVTKGYNFASVLQGTGGSSDIQLLVSDWQVTRGVMRAADVAMTTKLNRIAVRGALDFVNRRFDDVVVAFIDGNGCATVQQTLRGSFDHAVVERPSALRSLVGPALTLLKQGRMLVSGDDCEVFYAGSVLAPT